MDNDPSKASDAPTQDQVWAIARQHATEAMAAISEAQMKTWAKFPPSGGPTEIIAPAMVRAMKKAGVAYR